MTNEVDTCKKIQDHLLICKNCKSILNYDPNVEALLKSYSIKNDLLELAVYIVTGIMIILVLNLIIELKISQLNKYPLK